MEFDCFAGAPGDSKPAVQRSTMVDRGRRIAADESGDPGWHSPNDSPVLFCMIELIRASVN